MAKSKSFFGLRRGSTKSLTFQVLDGKQVTKDRVSVVANPKTSAQATQRQKLLPAVRFQAIFHDLIDHSWENVQYGQKSIQHFMKKALRANIINGMVKGQTGWVPNPYQISEGSLPSMGAAMDGNGKRTFLCNFHAANVSTYNDFLSKTGLQEGDQLTCIVVSEAGTNEQGIVYGMIYDRLIINEQNLAFHEEGAVGQTSRGLFNIHFGEGDVAAPCEVEGCAIILSRRTSSKWLRSTEYLDTHAVDADIQRAIESYMQANVAKTSPWYLNAADNNVITPADVEGGEWSPVMLGPATTWGSDTTLYLGARNKLYGNFAVVTNDGTSAGFAYSFAGLNSGKTVEAVTLDDFTQSQTRGNAVQPAAVMSGASFGTSKVIALPDGQPDQFLKASAIDK